MTVTVTYPDLREHVRRLEEHGYLIRVRRPINRDTGLHPLVRLQFRGGTPPDQRDGRGRARAPIATGTAALPPAVPVGTPA